jgi:Mrp family chromosome partitioning ATPase
MVDRIREALDRARDESDERYFAPPANNPWGVTYRDGRPAPAEESITYTQTRVIELSPDYLRRKRVISGSADPVAGHYGVMRTHAMQRMRANDWRSLVVTSPQEGAGKTLTAVNLAISMARDTNHTVLLVDLDLRRPGVLRYFTPERLPGISDYILDDRPIPELLINPGIERLVILPGHRPVIHSAEMLSSAKVVDLFEDMKSRYPSRLVIFDMPPVLASDDVLAFAPVFDAALLVIAEGDTRRGDLERSLELLGDKPILGTVLNRSEEPTTGYSYY